MAVCKILADPVKYIHAHQTPFVRYISFSWRFYPKQLTISELHHKGTNQEQQESIKYNCFILFIAMVSCCSCVLEKEEQVKESQESLVIQAII